VAPLLVAPLAPPLVAPVVVPLLVLAALAWIQRFTP
jgi:hypothetical protein